MVRAGEFSPNYRAQAAPAPIAQFPSTNYKRAGNYGEYEDVITSTGRYNPPNYNNLNPANSLGANLHQITSTLSHLQRFVEPGAEDDEELLMKDPFGDVLPYRGPAASNSAPPFQNWGSQPSNGASNSAPPFQNWGNQPPRRESIPYGNFGITQGRQGQAFPSGLPYGQPNYQDDPYRRTSDAYQPSFYDKKAGRRGSLMFGDTSDPSPQRRGSYPFQQDAARNQNQGANNGAQQASLAPVLTRPPPRGKGRYHISQTSFDIDEKEEKKRWEEDLKRQREYKKQLDEERKRKERLEDERLEAKVKADQAKMREEYENEIKQKKKKEEDRQKRLDRVEQYREKFFQEQNAKRRASETQEP